MKWDCKCWHNHMTQPFAEEPVVSKLVMQLEWQIEHTEYNIGESQGNKENIGYSMEMFVPQDDVHCQQIANKAHRNNQDIDHHNRCFPATTIQYVIL